MPKIGILTYDNNSNRGAILQALCLWKKLNNRFKNSNVEIINYRTLRGKFKRIFTLNPRSLIEKLLDYNTSSNFLRNQRALGSDKIVTDKHKKAINFLKKKNYDMIVVGSDQVWAVRKDKRITRPFPNAYYLDPNLDSIKTSYAASANKMKLESLSKSEIKTYKKHISAFDKISVRDEHTEKILEKLDIYGVKRVPDPTILVDIPQKNLQEILLSNGVDLNKPILAINQLKKDIGKPIIRHYKKKGYQIIAPNRSRIADVNLFGKVGPLEYYSLHKYFDFVITGSLHTTIFSIKNNTQFATIDYSQKSDIYKTETLLKEFSLLDRHIKLSTMKRENILDEIENCEKNLDKKHIQKRLSSIKQKGLSYIQELENILLEEK